MGTVQKTFTPPAVQDAYIALMSLYVHRRLRKERFMVKSNVQATLLASKILNPAGTCGIGCWTSC